MPSAPLCHAIVLANAIWRDPTTGTATILGTFSGLKPKGFPFRLPHLAVYYVLSDGKGRVPISVRISEGEGEAEEVVAISTQEVEFRDRWAVVESAGIFQGITFPHEGVYRVQVRSEGVVLAERRLPLHRQPEARVER
jgi:hypothetical protein